MDEPREGVLSRLWCEITLSSWSLFYIITAECKIRRRYVVIVPTIPSLYLGNAHTVQWDFRIWTFEWTFPAWEWASVYWCIWPGGGASVCVFFFSSTCLSPVNKTSGECGGRKTTKQTCCWHVKSHEICQPGLHVQVWCAEIHIHFLMFNAHTHKKRVKIREVG